MRSLWLLLLAIVVAPLSGADLTLAVELRWSGTPLSVPSEIRATPAGQAVRVTRFAALISQVSLVRADGGLVELVGQYGFIDAESGRMSVALRNVPEGDYTGLGLLIGLPTEVNHGDPGQWAAGHPLNPLVNQLHWGWQGGYVFLALEGKWRAAVAPGEKAASECGFSYHLATDARSMPVSFSASYCIAGATTIALALDLARVLRDVKIAADDGSESTHSAPDDPLAIQLAHAASRAWFWLEAKTTAKTPTPKANDTVARYRSSENHAQTSMTAAEPRSFHVPAVFPQPTLPADNPLTTEGVALGERLFFDVRLSRGGVQSCASCHAPERALSDGVALSRGAAGDEGRRNAMPLVNLAWASAYAWDGSQPRIRDQALAAMTNPIEMHAEVKDVVATLAADATMQDAFGVAFGSHEISAERIGLALEQYLLMQVSADSKFDRALRGAAELSADEQRGFALFMMEYDPSRGRRGADCFHCHGGPLFSDFAYKNNGLDLVALDAGRALVTKRDGDAGKFKTPSLRNVAVTAPYMHDGRFATLEDVVAHYDHGVKRPTALDPNLAKHPDEGMQLTSDEQRALVAFLRTLTDEKFGPQPSPAAVPRRYSSPSQ